MTEEQKDLLNKTNIPENLWEYCYIDKEGLIYSPITDNGIVVKSGKERYDNKNLYIEENKNISLFQKIKNKFKK